MRKDLPSDVKGGIRLIEGVESKVEDAYFFNRCFRNGLEYLEDHMEEEPESPHRQFIQNFIAAHAKNFLEKLPNLALDDLIVWLSYISILKKLQPYLDVLFIQKA